MVRDDYEGFLEVGGIFVVVICVKTCYNVA